MEDDKAGSESSGHSKDNESRVSALSRIRKLGELVSSSSFSVTKHVDASRHLLRLFRQVSEGDQVDAKSTFSLLLTGISFYRRAIFSTESETDEFKIELERSHFLTFVILCLIRHREEDDTTSDSAFEILKQSAKVPLWELTKPRRKRSYTLFSFYFPFLYNLNPPQFWNLIFNCVTFSSNSKCALF